MSKEQILIIEDDEDIREGVRILLESESYVITEAENGRKGLEALNKSTDLVILDIMMNGMSGLRTCEEIRKISNVPVLFLTAKAQESDKLIGLMAGGDDYLTKPFSYAELLGRVKALLRRYKIYMGKNSEIKEDISEYIEKGVVRVHRTYNEVFVNNEARELTDIEYNMLLLMMKNSGRIFSAQNLYESVWDEPYFYSSNSTVTVHIRKLRVKIENDPQNPEYIKTVWGKGYKFDF
ncbi:MAG: response regulator transcription factor [Anaerotignaceae bacterium]